MKPAPGSLIAARRFGVVCIFNRTSILVKFMARVGDGEWCQHGLEPGGNRWFAYKYEHANENRPPDLEVRFDSDLSGSRCNITCLADLQRQPALPAGSRPHLLQSHRVPSLSASSTHRQLPRLLSRVSFRNAFDAA